MAGGRGAGPIQRTASSKGRSLSLTEDYRCREQSVTISSEPAGVGDTDELLTLNIGPHHPATRGMLRLLATLEGEAVRDVNPIIGYVHTGIENTGDHRPGHDPEAGRHRAAAARRRQPVGPATPSSMSR